MFGLYLDIQKRKDIDELDESEVKGRWKSFMNKWYARVLLRRTIAVKMHSTNMLGTVEN